ncbi:hypothetical protein MRX96_052565, partial [Rhipicephalus microplus]
DSADLTYDICRMSGEYEASSDVAGYYPDLNIAGTHSHPSDLLARFRGSPENSGGYTVAESPEVTTQCSTNVESNGQPDEPINDNHECKASREGTDGRDDESNSDTDHSRDSSTPSVKEGRDAEDTDTASPDDSLAKASVRVEEGTAIERSVSGIGGNAESEHRATDTSREVAPATVTRVPRTSAELAQEVLRSAASLENQEERPSLVESGEGDVCQPTAKPDEEPEMREKGTFMPVPIPNSETEATRERDSDILCQVLDECSDSTASNNHASAPATDTKAKEQTPGTLSETSQGAISEALDSQETTREQAGALLPAGNVSPGHMQARERWITKLHGDLQGAEQEFYCTLDSPKSSFSFSSGYLSEDALSPSMRYHNSSSPLPQLSPSRLSPLLPTSCRPPQKETPPVMAAEPTQPPSVQAAAGSPPVEEVLTTDAVSASVSARPCSASDQPLRPEQTTQPPSPPFGAPTPLQKMSALVADIPCSSKVYDGTSFPSPFAPPTTSASATSGGSGARRRDGREGTAFKPTYSNAGHAIAGLRLTSSSLHIARPVPTQPHPTSAPRQPCAQEPIAYFVPAARHFQPVPVPQVARMPVESAPAAYDSQLNLYEKEQQRSPTILAAVQSVNGRRETGGSTIVMPLHLAKPRKRPSSSNGVKPPPSRAH